MDVLIVGDADTPWLRQAHILYLLATMRLPRLTCAMLHGDEVRKISFYLPVDADRAAEELLDEDQGK